MSEAAAEGRAAPARGHLARSGLIFIAAHTLLLGVALALIAVA